MGEHPHPNVIDTTLAPFMYSGKVCLPLQLCQHDVLSLVEGRAGVSEAVIKTYFGQAAAGLLHCHRAGVFHLDVKPDNLLVVDGVVKVADFGCATMTTGVATGVDGCPLTPRSARSLLPSSLSLPPAFSPASSESCSPSWRSPASPLSPATPAPQAREWLACSPRCGVAAMTSACHHTVHKCGTTIYAAPEALRCRDCRSTTRACRAFAPATATGCIAACATDGHDCGNGDEVDDDGCCATLAGVLCGASHRVRSRGEPSPAGVAVEVPTPYDAGKADVWSLGVSLTVCLTGFFPWEVARHTDDRYAAWAAAWRRHDDDVRSGVLLGTTSSQYHGLWTLLVELTGYHEVVGRPALSPCVLHLLVGMLNPDAHARMTMDDVFAHPWFCGDGERRTVPAPTVSASVIVDDGDCGGSDASSVALSRCDSGRDVDCNAGHGDCNVEHAVAERKSVSPIASALEEIGLE